MNKEILDELNKTEIALQESNDNPYTFEWMIRNNMMDCGSFLSPYDQKWSVLVYNFQMFYRSYFYMLGRRNRFCLGGPNNKKNDILWIFKNFTL